MFKIKSISIGMLALVLSSAILPLELRAQNIIFSPEVIQTVENSRAHDAFWSVAVRDTTGKILEGYNFEKLVRPASNIKLLTTATILNELGPDYTYSTKMYGLGHQEGDIWEGDIIIRGMGDPSISGKYYNEDRLHVLDEFFMALHSMGIKKIDGNLIGNDSFFDQQPYPEGWSWQDLSYYYGVEINALSFNNNAVDLRVYADGNVGETPEIEWFPFDTDYVNFVNEQVITPRDSKYDEYYRRLLGTNTIILRSKLPKNYLEKESLSVFNAPMFFLDTFKKYLEDGNIDVKGDLIVDDQPQEWEGGQYKVLADHRSVPLRKLLKQVNKESDNFYTEMLLKTAAARHFDATGSTELGLTLVKDFADSVGMDTSKIVMNDGSGMASSTLITTEDLTKLLVKMREHPQFDVYRNSLSIAGVDGSLENRFKSDSLQGKIRGKTGYVSGVRSLSGYMKASSGKKLVFSVITNNYTKETSYIDYIQEEIVHKLYAKY
ncbi:MAG: D-alanyl-D-alanine carboxypeptidase/D-alanyl-D-alanine-endopeptidase [Balneolaceae bacterium]|jgi:D-alanyl-D-alanine carboxypeptidase/D-alanyl-D-alanine-endopeptidase (penicillin-binding protein 4)